VGPYFYVSDKWTYGNILLLGDAANQNFKPFVEGILPGIICGDIAEIVAYNFIKGANLLSVYQKQVMDKLGAFFLESDLLLDTLYERRKSSDKKSYLLRLGISADIFSHKR